MSLTRRTLLIGAAVLLLVVVAVGVVVVRWTSGPVVPAAASAVPSCQGKDRTVTRPLPRGSVLTEQWEVPTPPDDAIYDLAGGTSTAYPAPAPSSRSAPMPRRCGPV